jgi:hypothetical protein
MTELLTANGDRDSILGFATLFVSYICLFLTSQGVASASRTDGSSMTVIGRSQTDPSRPMRRGSTRHSTRYFISQQIIHVDPVSNKSNPISYCQQFLTFGTWNVLPLVSSSSQIYQLSQNIDRYILDLLGLTETHVPGSGTTLLDNSSLLIHSVRDDGIKRQGVGVFLNALRTLLLRSHQHLSGS